MMKIQPALFPLLIFTAELFFAADNPLYSQTTLHTSGKSLLDVCGNTVVLRGINYAPFNWGHDDNSDETGEIEKTGANCVRLVWYVNESGAFAYTVANLDSALTRCTRHHMIPILELHDRTCDNDPSSLITLAQYYTQTAVADVLQKHKASLIVNIANEALYHHWSANAAAAAATYVNTYSSIITSLRTAGFEFPLTIDAPDCGTDITLFSTVASALTAADSRHNLIFSAHAYWYSYAGNDSTQMAGLISAAAALDYPVVMGEFANYQDNANPCDYSLNYRALLRICEAYHFPWICWSWDHDNCNARQLSANGTYASLSAYGSDIVNDTGYGLKYKAVRSPYLVNNGYCEPTGQEGSAEQHNALSVFQNRSNVLLLRSETVEEQKIIITDLAGRTVWKAELLPHATASVYLSAGMYLIVSDKQKSVKRAVE